MNENKPLNININSKFIKKHFILNYKLILSLFLLLFLIEFLTLYYFRKSIIIKEKSFKNTNNDYIYFDYGNYEKEFITNKILTKAGFELSIDEVYFLNGLIRKIKPRYCLEVGTSRGGSAIVILNALKDIENSFLISLDINTYFYKNKTFKTGYRVKKFFPELSNKWKIFTGKEPHQFLDKFQIKFDFVFLDTVHSAPGEIINLIEILPFLKDNSIIVMHDIVYHMKKKGKFFPSNIYLFPSLFGDKILIKKKISNIGAVFLYNNQSNHYIDYFLLLLSPWQYMPNNKFINELYNFIKKYYKNDIYLQIFNESIKYNEINVKIKN